MLRPALVAVLLAAAFSTVGCSQRQGGEEPQAKEETVMTETQTGGFALTSPVFAEGETIPERHTCDAEDLSPYLAWQSPPERTVAFAIICYDPDAPRGDWVHWVIYDIPGTIAGLPEGVSDLPELEDGSRQGRTDFGRVGYGGPCPPPGKPHRYYFELYALSAPTGLEPGATRQELLEAIKDKQLGKCTLMGRYGR